MSLRDRLTNPKDIERYDRNYNSMEVCITQGELDKEYIHIPNNATNGDMIKTLFPHISVKDNCQKYYSVDIENLSKDNSLNTIGFRKEWWDAPYKAKSEDK